MRHSMKTTTVGPYRSQASAFEGVPQRSLRMALCLNGSVPVLDLANAPDGALWLTKYLDREHAAVVPGPDGPITIVLVL